MWGTASPGLSSCAIRGTRRTLQPLLIDGLAPFFCTGQPGFAVGFSHHCGRTMDSQRAFACQGSGRASQIEVLITTVNLKTDMPLAHEALVRLESELALARQQRCTVLKLIHGYGSTGAGGENRIPVQKQVDGGGRE